MAIPFSGLKILLVEDSEDDVLLAKKVFSELGFSHSLHSVGDANEALDYLKCRGKYAGRKPVLPDLVLMDINLPMMDGFSLLKSLKADHELRRIPVIMLSTSSASTDISRSYACGAASYITKPPTFEEFKNVMAHFSRYWMSISALPQ
jgi:two-component system response regulator